MRAVATERRQGERSRGLMGIIRAVLAERRRRRQRAAQWRHARAMLELADDHRLRDLGIDRGVIPLVLNGHLQRRSTSPTALPR